MKYVLGISGFLVYILACGMAASDNYSAHAVVVASIGGVAQGYALRMRHQDKARPTDDGKART